MKIRAITRLKNEHIMAALDERGWTQADLARHIGVSQTQLGRLINLRFKGVGEKIVEKVAIALEIPIDKIMPEEMAMYAGPSVITRVHDVEPRVLLEASRQTAHLLIAAPEDQIEMEELRESIRKAVSMLSPRVGRAVTMMYGLDGETPTTLRKAAKELGVTCERVRQMVLRAHYKLKPILVELHVEEDDAE